MRYLKVGIDILRKIFKMEKLPIIYIAGPLKANSKLDKSYNILKSVQVADKLRKENIVCIIPHLLSIYNEDVLNETQWLIHDQNIISKCDGICLVIPPTKYLKSRGTWIEINFAKNNKIPIFNTVDDCIKHFKGEKNA